MDSAALHACTAALLTSRALLLPDSLSTYLLKESGSVQGKPNHCARPSPKIKKKVPLNLQSPGPLGELLELPSGNMIMDP